MADSNYSSYSSRCQPGQNVGQSHLPITIQSPTIKSILFRIKATMRNPDQYLIIDPKSQDKVEQQIKRQVSLFTRNTNVRKTDIVSMDKFTDMIKLEREFGKLHLGHDPLPQDVPSGDKKQGDPLWLKLMEVLTFSPQKMARLKELIDQAQIDMEQEYEKQRKKALEAFLKEKRTRKMTEDLQQLIKTTSGDPDQARLELAQIQRKKEEQKNNQKLVQIKKMLNRIQTNYNSERSRLQNIKEILNFKDVDAYRNQRFKHLQGKVEHTWPKQAWDEMQKEISQKRSLKQLSRRRKSNQDIRESDRTSSQSLTSMQIASSPKTVQQTPHSVNAVTARNNQTSKSTAFASELQNNKQGSITLKKRSFVQSVTAPQLRDLFKTVMSTISSPRNISQSTKQTKKEISSEILSQMALYCGSSIFQTVEQNKLQADELRLQLQQARLSQSKSRETKILIQSLKDQISALKTQSKQLQAIHEDFELNQVSSDQLETLQKCDYIRQHYPMVMRSIKLIQSYAQISDEFGFNPKQDRVTILKELDRMHTQIQIMQHERIASRQEYHQSKTETSPISNPLVPLPQSQTIFNQPLIMHQNERKLHTTVQARRRRIRIVQSEDLMIGSQINNHAAVQNNQI